MSTNMTQCHSVDMIFISNIHYYNVLAQQVTIIEFLVKGSSNEISKGYTSTYKLFLSYGNVNCKLVSI